MSIAVDILSLDEKRDWRRLRTLILEAEDIQLTREENDLLAPRLLDLAVMHRDSYDSADKAVVLSAIRTGASMLSAGEAVLLIDLLEPGHPIDTVLVTVKMVGRIFEAQPPSGVNGYIDLALPIWKVARHLFNPYAIVISQAAATAQLAIYALAAMAETHLRFTNFDWTITPWFTKQVARDLRELKGKWEALPEPVAPSVKELLDRTIETLQPSVTNGVIGKVNGC